MSYFNIDENLGFYLQNAQVKDWIDNSMLFFLEMEDVSLSIEDIQSTKLKQKYPKIRVSKIVKNDWGSEFFLHDPSGVLWHIGNFKT